MGIGSNTLRRALLVTLALSVGCASNTTSESTAANAAPEGQQESRRHKADDTEAGSAHEGARRTGAEPTQAATAARDSAAASSGAGQEPGSGAPPAASPGQPSVAMARFTTAVENREPVDAVSFLSNDQTRILFFSDLRNLNQTVVVHRWEYQGKVMAEVRFTVLGDRWRAWSSKRLVPEWLGDWRASVVTENGEVLATEVFTYQELP